MSQTLAYVALGANLGDPIETLLLAIDDLRALATKQQLELSDFYRTAPLDAGGPDYINAVVRFTTELPALVLLHALQKIENQHGRIRSEKNAPRTLDLDLLLYGHEQHATEELHVPHPRMHERAFVLYPLADLAPDMVLAQGPLSTLLEHVAGQEIEALGWVDDEDDL